MHSLYKHLVDCLQSAVIASQDDDPATDSSETLRERTSLDFNDLLGRLEYQLKTRCNDQPHPSSLSTLLPCLHLGNSLINCKYSGCRQASYLRHGTPTRSRNTSLRDKLPLMGQYVPCVSWSWVEGVETTPYTF